MGLQGHIVEVVNSCKPCQRDAITGRTRAGQSHEAGDRLPGALVGRAPGLRSRANGHTSPAAHGESLLSHLTCESEAQTNADHDLTSPPASHASEDRRGPSRKTLREQVRRPGLSIVITH